MSDDPPAPWGPTADAPSDPAPSRAEAAAGDDRRAPRSPHPARTPVIRYHWYQHPAVVLGSLVLCFPIGFVLVWLTPWARSAKVMAAGSGTLLAVALALASAGAPPVPTQAVSAGGHQVAPVSAPPAPAPTTTASTSTTSTSLPATTSATAVPTTKAPRRPAPTTARRAAVTTARAVAAPTPTAPPTTAATAKAMACNGSYTPCVPIADDVDCAGGGDGPAWITGPVRVIGPDLYDLDGNGDGVACE